MPRLPGISDVIALLQQQTEVLATLPATLVALNRSIRNLSKSIEQSRETIAAVQRLALRMDGLMDDLEEPMRAMAPGLQRLAAVLDDPVIDEIPATLRTVQEEVVPVVHGLRETEQRIATIAASTERLIAGVEEVATRVGGLPGAALLRRQWRAAGTPPDEM